MDSDADGVPDHLDAFVNDENEWADTDGDGVGDNADDFPNDATYSTDTDADGVLTNSMPSLKMKANRTTPIRTA